VSPRLSKLITRTQAAASLSLPQSMEAGNKDFTCFIMYGTGWNLYQRVWINVIPNAWRGYIQWIQDLYIDYGTLNKWEPI